MNLNIEYREAHAMLGPLYHVKCGTSQAVTPTPAAQCLCVDKAERCGGGR